MIPRPFILHSDHEALKYINNQQKLSRQHATWFEFLQSYSFTIKHKSSSQNIMADALSRKNSLLTQIEATVVGFEVLEELYENDHFFGNI